MPERTMIKSESVLNYCTNLLIMLISETGTELILACRMWPSFANVESRCFSIESNKQDTLQDIFSIARMVFDHKDMW